jgi:two-component system OmpR family response regulator
MARSSPTNDRLLRALVVEDDPGMRRLIVGIMELDGWDVREASDGAEAVSIAEGWRPDAVVVDVVLPTMDGLDAVREIRRMAGGAEVGMLVVASTPGTERDARAAGSDHFMVVPLDASELASRLRDAHGLRRRADGAPTDDGAAPS